MKVKNIVAAAVLTVFSSAGTTLAWGPDGHKMVARLAVATLPADTPQFLRAESERLQFLNFEPDYWRDPIEEQLSPALRQGHDPDHHFHFELFGYGPLQPDRYSFLDWTRRENKDPRAIGVLPYRAMELFQRLRVSFRRWRAESDPKVAKDLEARIIDDAGILGHYIADAAEPLHTSIHTTGWALSDNPRGFTRESSIHARFEADYVHARIKDDDVKRLLRPVQVSEDPWISIYQELRRSHDQVIRLYELEKAMPFGPNNSDLAAASFVTERLADAAATLRDLWYMAYRTSK